MRGGSILRLRQPNRIKIFLRFKVLVNQLQRLIRHQINEEILAIIVLALFVGSWNYWQFNWQFLASAQDYGYVHIDPITANSVIKALDRYTPGIDEQAVDLELTLISSSDGFIGGSIADAQIKTEPTELEIDYTVQQGDTLSTIAQKFGLTVATLIERNQLKIDEIENLKIGMRLIIPPRNLSQSTAWLDELNRKKEQKRQKFLAARARQLFISRSTSRETSNLRFEGNPQGGFIVPIRHKGISRGLSRYHMGIDYRANLGTPVVAAQAGRVIEITHGWAGGFGISVLLDHGGGLTTRYAHLSRAVAQIGAQVGQGQIIGYSGSTGYSTGPHLHFETRLRGRAIYPY